MNFVKNISPRIQVMLAGVLLLSPRLTLAQDRDFKSVVYGLTDFLETLVPVLTAAALLVFFWGLAMYIFQAGDEAAVESGRQRMVWGIAGIFVIVSIWGIVQFIGSSLSITAG